MDAALEQADFIQHTSCDKCGSSDANAEYSDGHTYCFSCEAYGETGDKEPRSRASSAAKFQTEGQTKSQKLLEGEAKAIPARGLNQETCQKFGYLTGMYQGKPVQIATYRDKHGRPVAQKIRTKDKKFSDICLYGL